MSLPRVRELPYNPRWNEDLESPDGTLRVSLNEEWDTILIHDSNGSLLASFLVDDLYEGPRYELLTSPLFQPGRNYLVSWSGFIPPADP